MQTHFSAHTLPEILRDLYFGERDGMLALDCDEVQKRIYLKRGLFHFAESDLEQDGLGARLVQRGTISAGALEEARLNVGTSIELPLVLRNRDLISQAVLDAEVRDHVGRILGSVMEWPGGRAEFSEGAQAPYGVEFDVLQSCQLFLQGIFSMADFRAIHEAMLGLDRTLRLREPSHVPLGKLGLSPAHGFVLSRIDGSSTLRDVVSLLPPTEEDGATRLLYGLILLGALDFDPPLTTGPFRVASILRDHAERQALEAMQKRTIEQAFKAMPGQDPFTILGITPGASRPAVERAYVEAKAQFSRERLLPGVREQFRSELAVIESRLIEAYLKLNQPSNEAAAASAPRSGGDAADRSPVDQLLVRVEMDKTQTKRERDKANQTAEGYFAHARKALREGDFHNAIQYGKLAISYNDRDPRYFSMLAECQMRNPGPRWQHLAEQNLSKAIGLDPWNVEYQLTLGRFYKRRGLSLRARKQFEEVLRLSPQHEAATEELHSLQ